MDERYKYIRIGSGVTWVVEAYGREVTTDDNGTGSIKERRKDGDYVMTLWNYDGQAQPNAAVTQLFFILLEIFTRNGNPCVELTLDEYMKQRDLHQRQRASEQLQDDALLLKSMCVQFGDRVRGKRTNYRIMSVFDDLQYWGRSNPARLIVTFGSSYAAYLSTRGVMPFLSKLNAINPRLNPNSFYFGEKILEFHYLNYGKPNDGVIAVKTLLKCPFMSAESKLQTATARNRGRIRERFERDMALLSEDLHVLRWEYCGRNGRKLTDDEIDAIYSDFNAFMNALIKFELPDYPPQAKRIKGRNKHIKDAQKQRKKQAQNGTSHS